MAARYLHEIRRVQHEGPYLLAGVCSGAVVAFEMAQQLWAQGQKVPLLAMVEPSPLRSPGLQTTLRFVSYLLRTFRQRIGHHTHRIVELPSTGQRDYMRLRLKVLANLWAVRRYVPRPYPGRIEIFLAKATLSDADSPRAGWGEFAEGGAQVHEIPGSHVSIVGAHGIAVEESHMRVLAEKMSTCIDNALREG